jgi:hypothetical protein
MRTFFNACLAGFLLPALALAQSDQPPGGSSEREPPQGRRPGATGGGGFTAPGGFAPAADPDAAFNRLANGKDVWKRDDQNAARFDRLAQQVGATGGTITREQFRKYMQERQPAQPPRGPGGPGGFGGGVMAPPGSVGRDREIEDLKRRVENLESMSPPFRRAAAGGGPGPTASGPRGFGGGSSGGFGAASGGFGGFPGGGPAPGGFASGAVSTFGRSTTTATSRSGDDGLAQLNEQIAAKRRELQQLEEQFRARMAERQRQQARPRQDSVEEKLDRLLREVDDIRRELRAPRGGRTGSSRGE